MEIEPIATKKLVQLCSKIGSGATPRGGSSVYLDSGEISLIRSQNVLNNAFTDSGLVYIEAQSAEKLSNVIVEKDDVLLNITGDSVARCCQVDSDVLPARVNQHVAIIRPKPTILNPKYLRYFLVSPLMQSYMLSLAGAGATRNALTKGMIENFDIPLPKLDTQKAIAHILGTLDDKIELNRQMNATLEAMAQALFKSWFVDFDPVIDNALAAGNPIPEPLQPRAQSRAALGDRHKPLPAAIQQQFPSRFVFNDDLGWVPEGWDVRSVEDAIEVNPKVDLKKGDIASFVDMKALPTSGYDITEVIKKAYAGGAKFQQGDVLLARITPCLENGKTGIVDFLRDNEAGFGSTEFIVLRGKGELRTAFVACLARYEAFRSHCELGMVGSSGRQRVQNSSFGDFFLALPEAPNLAKEFDRLASSNFQKMVMNKNEAVSLASLRDTLLPKLLSGQLRIPAAEKLIESVQ